MLQLLALVIVAFPGETPIEARHQDSVQLLKCGFEEEDDRNLDGWPDLWTRQVGPGFPHYVAIHVSQEPSAAGERSVRFNLNGGAAAIYSRAIEIDASHDYVLEGFMKTDGLVGDEAFYSVAFLDANKRQLEIHYSPRQRTDGRWTQVRLGPLTCTVPSARYAVIGLRVEPTGVADLSGAVLFDDVWFGQVPRMTLQVGDRRGLYSVGQDIAIECQIAGHRALEPKVELRLEDALGETLNRIELPLEVVAPQVDPTVTAQPGSDCIVAAATWHPPALQPGFYRVHATLAGAAGMVYRRDLKLAIIDAGTPVRQSEFGWSLPNAEGKLPLPVLVQLVSEAGIGWIKLPLWYDDRDQQRMGDITWLADRLGMLEIAVVGLLHEPPPETRQSLGITGSSSAASIFVQDPRLWYPSLEPIIARMSLKVRAWQLGRDEDTSFEGLADPTAAFNRVKENLSRIGQQTSLGVGWSWTQEVAGESSARGASPAPWQFLTRTSDPPLTADELSAYLAAAHTGQVECWVSLDPLPADHYDVQTRAADLVRRMVAAKEKGARRIFLSDPLSDVQGVVHADGSAAELFLPWRTAARALAGTSYVGRLELAGGSDSRVFARDGRSVIVVWNRQAAQEQVSLGEALKQVDVWGRSLAIHVAGGKQTIDVGPLPTFLFSVSEPLLECQLAFQLNQRQLPGVFGVPHPLTLSILNPFRQVVSGKLKIELPEGWKATPSEFDLRLGPGESAQRLLEVVIPQLASFGRHRLRFDFDLTADHPYQFSLYRNIDVGLGDLVMEVSTHVNAAGEMEVEQRLANRTNRQISFRCHLSVPNRRRVRKQVLRLGQGEDIQTYRLPAGADLAGQLLSIRAEEIGGQKRILNYTFTAEP